MHVAVKHAEARLWQERLHQLEALPDLAASVPRHALDATRQKVFYPPEMLLRY